MSKIVTEKPPTACISAYRQQQAQLHQQQQLQQGRASTTGAPGGAYNSPVPIPHGTGAAGGGGGGGISGGGSATAAARTLQWGLSRAPTLPTLPSGTAAVPGDATAASAAPVGSPMSAAVAAAAAAAGGAGGGGGAPEHLGPGSAVGTPTKAATTAATAGGGSSSFAQQQAQQAAMGGGVLAAAAAAAGPPSHGGGGGGAASTYGTSVAAVTEYRSLRSTNSTVPSASTLGSSFMVGGGMGGVGGGGSGTDGGVGGGGGGVAMDVDVASVMKEVRALAQLSQHPCIVRFIGGWRCGRVGRNLVSVWLCMCAQFSSARRR